MQKIKLPTFRIPFTSIAIIGYGDFGRLLVDIITSSSQDVRIGVVSSKPNVYRIEWEQLAEFEVVVSCVPISLLAESYRTIKSFARKDVFIRDICSIKEQPVAWMTQAGLTHYIATHPMFGPYSYAKKGKTLTDLKLVMTDHTCDHDVLETRRQWFEALGLQLIMMSSQEHDKYLAKTLFLTHYIAQIVHHAGFDRTRIDTVSFGFLMDAVESVKHDQQLFLDVWKYNSYCKHLIDLFVISQGEIHRLLGLSDRTDNS